MDRYRYRFHPVIRDCLTLILFPLAACALLSFVGVPLADWLVLRAVALSLP